MRVSSAKDVNSNETDTKRNGRLNPAVHESLSSPDTPETETKALHVPLLAKEKGVNNGESSKIFLDLPTLNHRSNSIDSGFRTASSCTGSEIDSSDVSMHMLRLSSKRSSIVTNVFVKQDAVYPEEVESIFSLDEKTAAQTIQRGSLDSGNSNNTATSGTSLQSRTASSSARNDDEEPSTYKQRGEELADDDDDDEDEGIVHLIPPKGWLKRVAYVILFPLIILLFFTLPNVRNPVSLNIINVP